jgi:hypothetical protein
MNNNEMRLCQLLRDYIGNHGSSLHALSREIGINPATMNSLIEGKHLLSAGTTAKLLYWLFTPVDTPLPTEQPVAPAPRIIVTESLKPSVPTVHKPAGRVVSLSPRMHALVNRQEQRSE